MVFSDTSTKLGLIQHCEVKVFGDDGYGMISGNTNRLYQFTARLNRAQDRLVYLAITADGRWQYDDTNYTDYPIATTDLVSNQRDYPFSIEHLEIEKVLIKDSAGNWTVLLPIDQNDDHARSYIENNSGNVGMPRYYDKMANSIFFDVTPNYSSTGGIKVYFKRGASLFVYTDTTKAPGFASIFHGYLADHASTFYGLDKGMVNAKNWYTDLLTQEEAIVDFFSKRSLDEPKIIRARVTSSR